MRKEILVLSVLLVSLVSTKAYADSTAESLNKIYNASLETVSKDSLEKKLLILQNELYEQKVIVTLNKTTEQSSSFADQSLEARKDELTQVVNTFSGVRENYLDAVKSGDLTKMVEWEHSYVTSIDVAGGLARLSVDDVSTFNSPKLDKQDTKDLTQLQGKIDSMDKLIATTGLISDFDYGVLPTSFPVAGPVSSSFGMRVDPIDGSLKFHSGVDIEAVEGTPVKAWFSGQVKSTEENNESKGNNLTLSLGDVETSYLHLSKIAVEEGQQVKQGDTIGYVGSTGKSTGPHLHLILTIQGNGVDPALILGGE